MQSCQSAAAQLLVNGPLYLMSFPKAALQAGEGCLPVMTGLCKGHVGQGRRSPRAPPESRHRHPAEHAHAQGSRPVPHHQSSHPGPAIRLERARRPLSGHRDQVSSHSCHLPLLSEPTWLGLGVEVRSFWAQPTKLSRREHHTAVNFQACSSA